MNSYAAMCKKHEKDDNNIKWDFGTFKQLQKSYNSKKAIKAICLLIRSRQLGPATLPFALMVK